MKVVVVEEVTLSEILISTDEAIVAPIELLSIEEVVLSFILVVVVIDPSGCFVDDSDWIETNGVVIEGIV